MKIISSLLSSLTVFATTVLADTDGLTVQTWSGKVTGTVDPANPNVRQFLGIPYAQPPLGDLRFAPPRALLKTASNRTLQTTFLPPSCLQYLGTGASVYTRNVLEFNLQGLNKTGSVSEDCLTLSVWTPTLDSALGYGASNQTLLPVLIFIYGGGFGTGGQDVPYQIPTQWVQRTRSHLVVSFNYRLSIFGFPNAAGLTPAEKNAGLLDQRLAVQWIRDNIRSFGGDPARMVLWGQSAGGQSVDFYAFGYPDDPIVSGLIMDSGTAQGRSTTAAAAADHSSFSYLASQVGCGNLTSDPAGELACMRAANSSAIENVVATHTGSPSLSFTVVSNNLTVWSNNTERALGGHIAPLPAIIGTNSEDGVPFTTYSPTGVNTTAALRAGLSTFFCPATETTRLRQVGSFTTYRYYYGGNFSNVSPEKWMGAYHSAELPMLMGTYDDFRGSGSELEAQTSAAMQDAYLAFAKGGEGALEETGWKKYEELGEGTVRNFGNSSGAGGGESAVQDMSVEWLERMCNGKNVL